jgi:hypothetical protein
MSQIVSVDTASLSAQSVSKNIRPLWRDAAGSSTKSRWQMVRRDDEGMAIVLPVTALTGASIMFAGNAETGAWATWDGWKPTCMAQFGDELLFGTGDGRIMRGESGGSDNELSYTVACAFPFYSDQGRNIHVRMAKALVRSKETCKPKLTIIKDYEPIEPIAPPVCVSDAGSLWNQAEWGQGVWGGSKTARQSWQAVSGVSSAVSILLQYTFSQPSFPQVEIIRADLISQTGGVMT